jgi:hypothetical protein
MLEFIDCTTTSQVRVFGCLQRTGHEVVAVKVNHNRKGSDCLELNLGKSEANLLVLACHGRPRRAKVSAAISNSRKSK